jgi:hypothetical protein
VAQATQFGTKLNIWAWLTNLMFNGIGILTNAGTPTNGTSGTGAKKAGPGCLLIDITNKVLYINTNTLASPTWSGISVGTKAPTAIAADGAILATVSASYAITKGSAALLTIAAPAASRQAMVLLFPFYRILHSLMLLLSLVIH